MDREVITQESEVKLVGYTFDEKMSWAMMISTLASKARSRLGMLTRLRRVLDDENMKHMYCTFIRPIMEYGSEAFMGAEDTHFLRLDQIQLAAEKIGRFKVEPISSRREAAVVTLTCKLLDGQGRGEECCRGLLPQSHFQIPIMVMTRLNQGEFKGYSSSISTRHVHWIYFEMGGYNSGHTRPVILESGFFSLAGIS
jgi:hypothetical protein